MVHDRQRLPLGLEPGDDLARVHARLEDLQGHLASDGVCLLGHEHHAEPALADLLQQFVRADDRTGALVRAPVHSRGHPEAGGRRFEEAARLLVGPQQALHPRPQLRIIGALAPHELVALRGGLDLHSTVEDRFGLFGVAVHAEFP